MSNLIDRIRSATGFCALEAADDDQISAAQEKLDLRFAGDFIEYVKAFGAASFDSRELTGICSSKRLSVVAATERARHYYLMFPHGLYVIEEPQIDHILIAQDKSGIIYSFGPSEKADIIANSLYDYLFPEADFSDNT